jgi:hypothetical protein
MNIIATSALTKEQQEIWNTHIESDTNDTVNIDNFRKSTITLNQDQTVIEIIIKYTIRDMKSPLVFKVHITKDFFIFIAFRANVSYQFAIKCEKKITEIYNELKDGKILSLPLLSLKTEKENEFAIHFKRDCSYIINDSNPNQEFSIRDITSSTIFIEIDEYFYKNPINVEISGSEFIAIQTSYRNLPLIPNIVNHRICARIINWMFLIQKYPNMVNEIFDACDHHLNDLEVNHCLLTWIYVEYYIHSNNITGLRSIDTKHRSRIGKLLNTFAFLDKLSD